MTSKIFVCAALMVAAVLPAVAKADMRGTVNTYSTADEARVREIVANAGYTAGPIQFAQAGSFFLTGSKAGQTYSLTVTSSGQVYAEGPRG